jgi:hypothetical protein
MNAACDPCVATICNAKQACCNNTWAVNPCINDVATLCGNPVCGTASCGHSLCLTGNSVDQGCNPCAGAVCALDSFCCDSLLGLWDSICVSEVNMYCTTLTCP